MSTGPEEYSPEWALQQYPEICRSCSVVCDAVLELLPAVTNTDNSDYEHKLAVDVLKMHAKSIEETCIKAFLVQDHDINDVWGPDEECWLKNSRYAG